MEISEVTITLVEDPEDRVKGYCSIIVNDALVVRGIKIIEGRGGYFVAMPSRKMSDNCEKCDRKNHVRARYCNYCGTHLLEDRREKGRKERTNLYADIVHPINAACRQTIQERVIEAFHNELELSAQADYQSANLDDISEAQQAPTPLDPQSLDPARHPDDLKHRRSLR